METKANVKGLVLIPAPLRREFGVEAGTRFDIRGENGRIVLEPINRVFVERLCGILKDSRALDILMEERRKDREREERRHGRGSRTARVR